jgi:3-oxoadipate enol-lactonase
MMHKDGSRGIFSMSETPNSQIPVLSFTEEGSGPPLVLIHGLMMSGRMYLDVLPRFAEKHRVICPDLRGHAGSAGLGPPYTIPQLARDVVNLLDRLGVDQFDLFGYSNGGIVAECIGATCAPRVRRLVLACAYAYNRETLREKVEAAVVPWVIRGLGMQKFSRFMFAHPLGVGAESVTSLAEIMGSNDKDLMLKALHEGMFFDARPLLPNIKAPTLIIAGAKDDAVPMHHADQLVSDIDGARLEVLPEGNHTLIWTNPDDVVAITERFLEA